MPKSRRKNDDIFVITTGGTIGGDAYADPNNPPKNVTFNHEDTKEGTIVVETINQIIRSNLNHALVSSSGSNTFYQKFHADSKDISDEDLLETANLIKSRPEKYILITHGTDTLAQNSRKLAKLLQDTDKTVVLTGAMIPLKNGKDSDGLKNIRYAIMGLPRFGSGVHVVIGGHEHGEAAPSLQTLKPMHFSPIGLVKNADTKAFYHDANKVEEHTAETRSGWAFSITASTSKPPTKNV